MDLMILIVNIQLIGRAHVQTPIFSSVHPVGTRLMSPMWWTSSFWMQEFLFLQSHSSLHVREFQRIPWCRLDGQLGLWAQTRSPHQKPSQYFLRKYYRHHMVFILPRLLITLFILVFPLVPAVSIPVIPLTPGVIVPGPWRTWRTLCRWRLSWWRLLTLLGTCRGVLEIILWFTLRFTAAGTTTCRAGPWRLTYRPIRDSLHSNSFLANCCPCQWSLNLLVGLTNLAAPGNHVGSRLPAQPHKQVV